MTGCGVTTTGEAACTTTGEATAHGCGETAWKIGWETTGMNVCWTVGTTAGAGAKNVVTGVTGRNTVTY